MERWEALQRLKFLHDQVHQTAERCEHLGERMPMHVQAASLNYEQDLMRVQGDYNRLVRAVQVEGLFTVVELEAEGLPLHFDQGKGRSV